MQDEDLPDEPQRRLADGVVRRQLGLDDRQLHKIPGGEKTEWFQPHLNVTT